MKTDQPKPATEWTEHYVENELKLSPLRIVMAHNAALAAADANAKSWHDDTVRCEEEISDLKQQLAAERKDAEAWRLTAKGKEGAYVKMEQELAYLKLQRDALLKITWLDLPDEPDESTAKWQELFNKGWVRRDQLAAEREKVGFIEADYLDTVQTLVDALKKIKFNAKDLFEIADIVNAALARVKEGKRELSTR